ncbi:MAG TPA: hypothetical protein PKD54_08200 [Pirellulaceae bacterium]|nr:hypothetical protein [Pirellulaceae bacterium]
MSEHQSSKSSAGLVDAKRSTWWIVFAGIVLVMVILAVIIDQVNRSRQTANGTTSDSPAEKTSIGMMQSIDELKRLHDDVVSRYSRAAIPGRIEILNQRKQICRRIETLAKRASDKQFATVNLIQAQAQLHALHQSNRLPADEMRQELIELIEKYEADANIEVARAAALARLTLAFSEWHRIPDSPESLQSLNHVIRDIGSRYAGDLEAITNLDSMVSVAVETPALASSLPAVLEVIHSTLIDSPEENAHLLAQKARDEQIIRRAKYPVIYRELVAGNASTNQSFVEFIRVIVKEEISPVGLGRIVSEIRHLEGYQWFDAARESYALCLESVKTRPWNRAIMQTLARRVQEQCEAGLQRLDMLGKPLVITGIDFQNQVIDPDKFKGRVIWLLFVREPESLRDMQRLIPQIRALTGRGLYVVFVFSSIPKTDTSNITESLLWQNSTIVIEPGFRGEFGRQVPQSFDSFSVIVGADGTVKELAVPTKHLLTRLEANLYIANKAQSTTSQDSEAGGSADQESDQGSSADSID